MVYDFGCIITIDVPIVWYDTETKTVRNTIIFSSRIDKLLISSPILLDEATTRKMTQFLLMVLPSNGVNYGITRLEVKLLATVVYWLSLAVETFTGGLLQTKPQFTVFHADDRTPDLKELLKKNLNCSTKKFT